jgi:hypothetical protein
MDLVQLLVVVVVMGLVYFLIMQLPIPQPFLTIVQVIAVLIAIIWLLDISGMWSFGHPFVGRIRR